MPVNTDIPPLPPPPAKKEENGDPPLKAASVITVQSTANGGDAVMTIEFLRARLLSERSASKAAQTQAKQHQARILELQQQIEGEIARRKKAEEAVDQVFQSLKSKGLPIEPLSLLHLHPSSSSDDDDSSTASEPLVNRDMAPPESTESLASSDQQKQAQVWEDKGTLVESNTQLSINHNTITSMPAPTIGKEEEGIDKTSPGAGALPTCYNEKERQLTPGQGQGQDQEKEKEKGKEKENENEKKEKDVATNPNYSTTLVLVPEKTSFSKELHNGTTSDASTTTTTLEGRYPPVMLMAPHAHYWNIPFATAPPDYPHFLPQMQASPYFPYPYLKAPPTCSPQTVPGRIGKPQASYPPHHFTSFIPSEWGGGGGGNNMMGQEDVSPFPMLPSLANEKSGRLGDVLTALRMAKKQVITGKQGDCPIVTSPKEEEGEEEEEEEKQSTGDSYDYHVASPPPYLEHDEGIRAFPPPWQCWSPYYAPPPGLVPNIPPSSHYNQNGLDMARTMPPPLPPSQSYYYKPKREVQLGNGITLYMD